MTFFYLLFAISGPDGLALNCGLPFQISGHATKVINLFLKVHKCLALVKYSTVSRPYVTWATYFFHVFVVNKIYSFIVSMWIPGKYMFRVPFSRFVDHREITCIDEISLLRRSYVLLQRRMAQHCTSSPFLKKSFFKKIVL